VVAFTASPNHASDKALASSGNGGAVLPEVVKEQGLHCYIVLSDSGRLLRNNADRREPCLD
jgi:hypothetical protein